MHATPCTLNLLQISRVEEGKCHLQNLQQFQSKFEVKKQMEQSRILVHFILKISFEISNKDRVMFSNQWGY
jgi:hypothetical protein